MKTKQPNFIVIFTDDQGYADVGCFGARGIDTPNLDRMAEGGVRLTDFYAAAPVCSASRAALMTGRYPLRTGVHGVLFPHSEDGLPPEEITIAKLVKQAGYATACVGKWHLGHLPRFLPTNHGFDSYFGIPYSNDMKIDPDMKIAKDAVITEELTPQKNRVPLMRQDEIIEYPVDQSQITKRYTEEAVSFIDAHREQPFFLYLAHTMPHVPLFVSERFQGSSGHGLYGDVIQEIDWSVGEILDTLKRLEIEENTFVIFASDNGPWLEMGENGGHAAPLRDGKFSPYEGGFRVPCIMQWPGVLPAGIDCFEIASTIDVLPTFANLAGVNIPVDRLIDGEDILPMLANQPGSASPHEFFFYAKQAIRNGQWKLYRPGTYNDFPGVGKGRRQPISYDYFRLYDLTVDISEVTNLADQYPDIVERLSQALAKHVASLED